VISRVLRTLAAFGGIAHSPRRAYSRIECSFDVCCRERWVLRMFRRRNRAWPTQAGTVTQCLHQGRKSCGRTYQPPFLSFLLLARPPYATSLRLCVGPALQVSQALPRGGAESDFSAPTYFIGNDVGGPTALSYYTHTPSDSTDCFREQ
jgi:hypothetical protein